MRLPGLLPYGYELTVGQLMSDTSGLVGDNDMAASPAAFARAVANIGDAELRANLTTLFGFTTRRPSCAAAGTGRLRADDPARGGQVHHVALLGIELVCLAPSHPSARGLCHAQGGYDRV